MEISKSLLFEESTLDIIYSSSSLHCSLQSLLAQTDLQLAWNLLPGRVSSICLYGAISLNGDERHCRSWRDYKSDRQRRRQP